LDLCDGSLLRALLSDKKCDRRLSNNNNSSNSSNNNSINNKNTDSDFTGWSSITDHQNLIYDFNSNDNPGGATDQNIDLDAIMVNILDNLKDDDLDRLLVKSGSF